MHMVSARTVKCISTLTNKDWTADLVQSSLTYIDGDNKGQLFRLEDAFDLLTGLRLHLYLSLTDPSFQRVGNIHQLKSLYLGANIIVTQNFTSNDTLVNIYDMLLDKEDWLDEYKSLKPLKSYLFSLFSFFYRYRNDNNIIADPWNSSVIFPTRLLSSSGTYIYLSGTISDGCLVDTRIINTCMCENLPSLDICLPELLVDLNNIAIDAPHKIVHMKQRLERANTEKDISEFMMQLRLSIELVKELRRTSPFIILPGYSIKMNEINLLVPYFETLKDGLSPQAYVPLRRSEDGIYRPQTIYSPDLVRKSARLFGYTHISGGVLV